MAATACSAQQPDVARLEALRDELLPRIEQVTGLAPRGEIRIETRDRATLRAFIERRMREELPPGELEGARATYAHLGLLPDTLDLQRLFLELYTEQVVGYYDPKQKTLYVMDGVPAREVETVLAHELVHALQDQHIDLDSLIARERGNDRQTAAQAAIEGHATLAMLLLALPGGAPDPALLPDLGTQLRPALEAQSARTPVFGSAPPLIRELLLFPYLGGAGFVQRIWRAEASRQPTAASRLPAFTSLIPESTEQVLHPELAFLETRDAPTSLAVASPPAGWTPIYESTLGELETRILLRLRAGEAAEADARGWDGDAYRLIRDAAGRDALVWYSIWDDAASADAFAARLRSVYESDSARHAAVERFDLNGRPAVSVLSAPRDVPLARVPRLGVSLE